MVEFITKFWFVWGLLFLMGLIFLANGFMKDDEHIVSTKHIPKQIGVSVLFMCVAMFCMTIGTLHGLKIL